MISFEERWLAEHTITDIVFGYSDTLDTGDLQRLGEVFRHGRIRVDGSDAVQLGTQGVIDMFRRAVHFYDGIPSTKHVTTNLRIQVDDAGEIAHAQSYFTVLQARPGFGVQVVIAGRYVDTFERIDGQWWLTDRFEHCDLMGDLSHHLKRHVPPGVEYPALPREGNG